MLKILFHSVISAWPSLQSSSKVKDRQGQREKEVMEKYLLTPTSSALTTAYWCLLTLNANKNDQHMLHIAGFWITSK